MTGLCFALCWLEYFVSRGRVVHMAACIRLTGYSRFRMTILTSSPSRSGVFKAGSDKRLEAFGESISFDHRLYRQDIKGSIAHARMLSKQGLISTAEFEQIERALREIEVEIEQGKMAFRRELEDIHIMGPRCHRSS
jgi:hypothetical protein